MVLFNPLVLLLWLSPRFTVNSWNTSYQYFQVPFIVNFEFTLCLYECEMFKNLDPQGFKRCGHTFGTRNIRIHLRIKQVCFLQVITDFKAPDGVNKEHIDAAGDGK